LPFGFESLVVWSPEPFLTVLCDNPVRLEISLSESCSRNFMRLTLPVISMVITFLLFC